MFEQCHLFVSLVDNVSAGPRQMGQRHSLRLSFSNPWFLTCIQKYSSTPSSYPSSMFIRIMQSTCSRSSAGTP